MRFRVVISMLFFLIGATVYGQSFAYKTVADFNTVDTTSRWPVTFSPTGIMYGTTMENSFFQGSVWKFQSGALQPVHEFGQSNTLSWTDGISPASVTFDAAGNMYGLAERGGSDSYGMLWRLDTKGNYKDLADFGIVIDPSRGYVVDGFHPQSNVLIDSKGNIWGTTFENGIGFAGTIWTLSSTGVFSTVHSFGLYLVGYQLDSSNPQGLIAMDTSGNIYGTACTYGADPTSQQVAIGCVWKFNTVNKAYSILHYFLPGDGNYPIGGVMLDANNNLYGTTSQGGANNNGAVWKLTPSGNYTILHNFGGTVTSTSGASVPDGNISTATVTLDSRGNMYGTTLSGGAYGKGMAWEITSGGVYYDIHDFGGTLPNGNPDGSSPYAPIVIGPDGLLYGTCSAGGANGTGTVWAITPGISSVSVATNPVIGGYTTTGTVSLAWPTPSPVTVALTSNNSSASVPGSVTIAPNTASATFPVQTSPTTSPITATITASYSGSSVTTSIAINPVTVKSLSLSPNYLLSGLPSTATVTLNSPSTVLRTVTLSSSSSSAALPATLTIPANATTGSFQVTTSPVSNSQTVNISASCGGVTQTQTLTLIPLEISSVSLSQNVIVGGSSIQGTATLNGPAWSAATVTLSSSISSVSVPASVIIPAGASSATFTITAGTVKSNQIGTISATLGGIHATATLTAVALSVSSLSVSPNPVNDGDTCMGTVFLNGYAPSTGAKVTISCSSKDVGVPQVVTVSAGQNSARFVIDTPPISTKTTVTVTAECGGGSASANLSINPPVLKSLSFTPSEVDGGKTSSATVSLAGPATVGGVVVSLSSASTSVVTPKSVTIPWGKTSATFTVSTKTVGTTQTVPITATFGSSQASANLRVLSPQIVSLTFNPSVVQGGGHTTGTVLLNSAAPAGGVVVQLGSNSSLAALSSASVLVSEGKTTATFTVSTTKSHSQQTVTITAWTSSQTKQTQLTIK